MMKAQGTAIDKLADILQILQLARKTGRLSLERVVADNVLEAGVITLQDGRITDASIGSHRGTSAVDLLSKWEKCSFAFYPSSVQKNPSTPNPVTPRIRGILRSYGEGEKDLALLNRNVERTEPILALQSIPNAPYRVYPAEEVLPYFLAMGFSRAHRQLFLLIDGQRMLPELIRLTGRIPDEVETLLDDLKRVGLVR